MKKALVICGPTACGKTNFAHHLALKYKGEIINCDSMQVYKEIPIITASPSEALKRELPYHLYNFLSIKDEFSFSLYATLAAEKIRAVEESGRLPIIVGGTGMYINALLEGYNQIPSIDEQIREYIQKLYLSVGQEEFYRQLTKLDPVVENRIKPRDKQRSMRAYEVFAQTGKSIFSFQNQEKIKPLPEFNFQVILLQPERNFLYENCNKRLVDLFTHGAIEEIQNIQGVVKSDTPAMKALGVQEIIAFLNNKISLDQAIILAQTRTRQYAKRQVTWFKHQLKGQVTLEYSSSQELETLTYNLKR